MIKALAAVGVAYEFQAEVGGYCVDFKVGRLVIEADGRYWHSRPGRPERDRQRDEELTALGFRVVRLTEAEIKADAVAAVRRGLEETR